MEGGRAEPPNAFQVGERTADGAGYRDIISFALKRQREVNDVAFGHPGVERIHD